MKVLARYINGNYAVTLYEDGTKIMENDKDYFDAEFPDNIDFKITNRCEMNCPMCHERSNSRGKHMKLNELKFIETLHPRN